MKTLSKPKLQLSNVVSVVPTERHIDELSKLYDRIYNIADRLIKKHNPCKIRIKNNKILCAYYTTDKNNEFYLPQNKLCCLYCNKGYWSKEGCTVKALGCKLFLCQAVKNKILKKRFEKLRDYCSKYLSFNYRHIDGLLERYSIVRKYHLSKEDWLKQYKKREE